MVSDLQTVQSLIAERKRHDAAILLEKLIAKKKPRALDWRQAIAFAENLGDIDSAITAAKKWMAQHPADASAQLKYIELLGAAARPEKAIQAARALRKNPNAMTEAYFFEGFMSARIGEGAAAVNCFRKALNINPHHTPSWEQIALMGGYDDLQADIAKMEELKAASPSADMQIPICYALGRAYDRAGDYDRAFENVAQGAAMARRLQPFNIAPQLAYMQRLQQTFTSSLLNELSDGSSRGANMIFLAGAPRSGTTLVEQILATVKPVSPTGEHTLIRLATNQLGSMEPPDMEQAQLLPQIAWRDMATAYEKHLVRRFGTSEIYTDKSLLAHYFIGAIRLLFPAAKIIWCRRAPRDVVWSCHRSRITSNLWAYDLNDACQQIIGFDTLMEHWASVTDGAIHSIRYEDIIETPDETTKSLFSFCGLSRPDNWRDFYAQKNSVATASVAQVRQPLYSSAVGSWRRFEQYLKPVYDRHFQ